MKRLKDISIYLILISTALCYIDSYIQVTDSKNKIILTLKKESVTKNLTDSYFLGLEGQQKKI